MAGIGPGFGKGARRVLRGVRSLDPGTVYPVVLLALLGVGGVVWVAGRQSPVAQPIAFNHRKHTQELGLGCEFCHQYVLTGAHAGLPDGQTCGLCHQAQQGTSEAAARLTARLARGEPVRFNKLFRLAGHVYYSHRRHAGIAKIECKECHGGIADTERPPTRPLVRFSMNVCRSCHRARGQSVDCVACHR